MFIILACWGMPPNYLRRFDAAHNLYGRTLQPDAWKSFLDIVRQERAAANVLVSNPAYFMCPNKSFDNDSVVRLAASVWLSLFLG